MNHRDLALAAMRGAPVKHVPFIVRMDLWYGFHRGRGTLPAPYAETELWDLQRDLGIGIFGFGAWDISFYRLEHPGVEVVKTTDGTTTTTEYRTPRGILTCRDTMADELKEAAGTAARVEYPFKSEADYPALQYLFEDMRVVANFEEYRRFVDAIGADGLALPFAGHLPAHQLMIHHMGYERFYYELHEKAPKVQRLIDALAVAYMEILRLAAQSPAEAIEVGGNYDEQMTPPPVFERFFAPLYREARVILEAAGRLLVVHGDGEMRRLLAMLMDCGVQVVEALTPQPMTTIDTVETRRLWGDRVAMWGGIPSIILTNVFSNEDFEAYLRKLFTAVAPGDRFILGFGDNVPTDALFDRVVRVAEFWRENGGYPLQ